MKLPWHDLQQMLENGGIAAYFVLAVIVAFVTTIVLGVFL